ncbi:MAG TPA: phage tail sheath subtilisin-like domain-containing protein [Crinalium sp.]|jgi:hypothetical protein
MAEDTFTEFIVPGTFIRVQSEGLISVGGISAGNIGIVGTAAQGTEQTHLLSDYAGALGKLGNYDAYSAGTLNLARAVELLYKNGARTVFARALAAGADKADFTAAFNELVKEDINIVVAPELSTTDAKEVLGALVASAEANGRDLIAVIGSDATTTDNIKAQVVKNGRIVMTTPGVVAFDAIAKTDVALSGTYSAAAVAGLISSLAPQASPTNKVLPGVVKLANRFTYGEVKDLLQSRFLVLEDRQGIRVVRGLTTDDAAYKQITTRRIVDYAKAGIRQACDPFIGRLNNQRVRKAMQGTIDGFLTTMVQDEALTGYTLNVSATRADEIAGRAIVNAVLQPTFSIDFVAVTLVLQ